MNNYYQKELPVCGFEAVKALAAEHPERISRLFFTGERAKAFGPVCKYLAQHKRLYRLVQSDAELEKLSGSVHHQGVTAMIFAPVIPTAGQEAITAWEHEKAVVLMLDSVGNANNAGALIRSAAFFGIRHIVMSGSDDQMQITTSAYRIAQGGMEFVNIYTVSSAERFLQQCNGRLVRIGADHRAYRTIDDLSRIVTPDDAVLVVLGNEETGISPEVKKLCDSLVRIRGAGVIESLNVAQAGTLFCAALSKDR